MDLQSVLNRINQGTSLHDDVPLFNARLGECTSLDMFVEGLHVQALGYVSSALRRNASLECLSVTCRNVLDAEKRDWGRGLYGKGLKGMLEALIQREATLKSLAFRNVSFDGSHVALLVKILERSPKLTALVLMRCNLRNGPFKTLLGGLPRSKLTHLCLAGNPFIGGLTERQARTMPLGNLSRLSTLDIRLMNNASWGTFVWFEAMYRQRVRCVVASSWPTVRQSLLEVVDPTEYSRATNDWAQRNNARRSASIAVTALTSTAKRVKSCVMDALVPDGDNVVKREIRNMIVEFELCW